MTVTVTALDHAFAYAARGWRVAPIAPDTKWPRVKAWQDVATTDPATVGGWWERWPDSGVSIVTGAASGLIVIDVDPRHDGDDTLADLEHAHDRLPDTVEAITGGGGRHLYLRMPDGVDYPRNDQAGIALGHGLDVRGDGGQVVAPPTSHPDTGRPYVWEVEHSPFDGVAVAEAPGWLVELLTAPPAPPRPRRDPPTRTRLDGEAPGDVWAAENAWADVLAGDGWTLHSTRTEHRSGAGYELWTRPGKDVRQGASASLYYGGSDVLKVFTTNPPAGLEAGATYTRWGYHVATRHDGDYVGAAREHRQAINAELRSGAPMSTEPGSAVQSRPSIVHNGRQLDDNVADAIDALVAANDPPQLFVRVGQLVRVRQDEAGRPLIDQLRPEHVRLALADAATWWRALKAGGHTATSPPLDVAASVLVRAGWPLPSLTGIAETPVLRPDGTFQVAHGYDPTTRLYHWSPLRRPIVLADHPSAAEAATARALLEDLLCDFPFATTADRANAWALLLTPIVRPVIGLVPMALLDAPQPATGKTLLASVATIVATGRPVAMGPMPTTDEELDKRITTMLQAGVTTIAFDNVERTVRSGVLAAALTSDIWSSRTLGRLHHLEVPNRATWLATGNNVDVGGDMARRCYRIRLEPAGAAEGRTFTHTPLAPWVAEHREQLVGALCTIVASWWTAGRPRPSTPVILDSFEQWVEVIGGVLAHAGVDGFLANQPEFRSRSDREASAWEALLAVWLDHYGPDRALTIGELIIGMETSDSPLRAVLPDELAAHWDTKGFKVRLGMAVARRVGRWFGAAGLHFVEMPPDRTRQAHYCVASTAFRPSRLFESESSARPNPVTRHDEVNRGARGTLSAELGENTEEKTQGWAAEKAPQAPQLRADECSNGDEPPDPAKIW